MTLMDHHVINKRFKDQNGGERLIPILKGPETQKRAQKNVFFRPEQQLERVKFFKRDDEPNAPGLSREEVLRIQKEIKAGNYKAIGYKNVDKEMEHKMMMRQKQEQKMVQQLLSQMKPLTKWDYRYDINRTF